ncbi:MAG TPA: hypothetical protein VF595_00175 [Tepidisphaeraceae bacterium]|jgi:hypothetical protein
MTNLKWIAIIGLIVAACLISGGCAAAPQYGRERGLALPGPKQKVWAVAPVVNLSGQQGVDPLLQADLVYQQLQTVAGLTVVPVDRVAQVYAAAGMEQIQSAEQAHAVIDALGCDGLVVMTVTQFDPYNPPKVGAAMQLFERDESRLTGPDPQQMLRAATPGPETSLPRQNDFTQVVGMYDSTNGTVRDALNAYARGRHEPAGPMGAKEYFASMDRFCGFAYYSLTESLLVRLQNGR